MKISTIEDVAEWQLCTGCGVCAYVQPGQITMVDDPQMGRRPVVSLIGGPERTTDEALAACPGIGLTHGDLPPGAHQVLGKTWGPVLEVWEGKATDEDLSFRASSGGVSTALAIHGIEQLNMAGVLHIASREDAPLLNETRFSTDRAGVLAAVGSRYSPASPGDGLARLEQASRPSVMIGKPCDIAGARKALSVRPALRAKLGLTIAIFCAGTPTLAGTMEMLRAMGVDDPTKVRALRYRGHGWPGEATATVVDSPGVERSLTLSYQQSWSDILQRHRQWRCYVCPDHSGEFADIAVGDPWDTPPDGTTEATSLIVVRTEQGRRALISAMQAGVVAAVQVDPLRLPAAQPWLAKARGATGARVAALRLVGIPTPRYRGMPMWSAWFSDLTLREKLQSTVGTLRRIRRKRLNQRHPVREWAGGLTPPQSTRSVGRAKELIAHG